MATDFVTPVVLGVVEGLTEFLPVSSTGHLILASELLGYDAARWALFNVVIQLGAILAVIVLYWRTFWAVTVGLVAREPVSWQFVRNLLVAFFPAVVIGLAFHKQIEAMLGEPAIVAWALIAGGVGILLVERLLGRTHYVGIAELPVMRSLGIGLVQCLAMVPGVSRSGATIMGAMALGVERRTAAEFSFFLAVPTMLGATALELVKNRAALMSGGVNMVEIAIGFVVSFLVAWAVIKAFVGFVSKYGFGPFAWYRIVAGAGALVWLTLR